MRCLYVMPALPWPPHGGREISAHYVLRAMVERGHDVHVFLRDEPDEAERSVWPLTDKVTLWTGGSTKAFARLVEKHPEDSQPVNIQNPSLHPRWLRYFGDTPDIARRVAHVARHIEADYVEGCGLQVLPWMVEVPSGMVRSWLAADEGCWFHLSQLGQSRSVGRAIRTCYEAVALAAYERSYAAHVDAAFVVSPRDVWAMRRIGGFRNVILARNGVDHDRFRPRPNQPIHPLSVLFWGRLDFQPNLDAIHWFARRVWPRLSARHPDAVWRVIGKHVPVPLHELADRTEGLRLIGPVTDVRPWIAGASVCVLPMRSGGGIKNKLLEAAAMARPIVASPRATRGLMGGDEASWVEASSPAGWVEGIERLWSNPSATAALGQRARVWVVRHHDWSEHARAREDVYESIFLRSAAPKRTEQKVAA